MHTLAIICLALEVLVLALYCANAKEQAFTHLVVTTGSFSNLALVLWVVLG